MCVALVPAKYYDSKSHLIRNSFLTCNPWKMSIFMLQCLCDNIWHNVKEKKTLEAYLLVGMLPRDKNNRTGKQWDNSGTIEDCLFLFFLFLFRLFPEIEKKQPWRIICPRKAGLILNTILSLNQTLERRAKTNKYLRRRHFLTNLFIISKLQSPSLDVPKLNKIRWSPDLEALKLWKGSSG